MPTELIGVLGVIIKVVEVDVLLIGRLPSCIGEYQLTFEAAWRVRRQVFVQDPEKVLGSPGVWYQSSVGMLR